MEGSKCVVRKHTHTHTEDCWQLKLDWFVLEPNLSLVGGGWINTSLKISNYKPALTVQKISNQEINLGVSGASSFAMLHSSRSKRVSSTDDGTQPLGLA